MQKTHKTDISDASLYAVSLEDVVLRLRKDPQGRSQFKCLRCDTLIPSRPKLSVHLCVGPGGEVTCKTLCPEGVGLSHFQTLTFLKRKQQYLCHTCGAAFSERATFTLHVQSHGKGVEVKRFSCEFCPFTTNNRSYFKVHVKAQHGEQPRPRPHVCELCGKAFAMRSVLMQHKQYIHVKDKAYPCSLCPKFFYRQTGLVRHMQTHSGQRPWVCSTCGQGFLVKYNLKVHERVHSGEKPYKCAQCPAAFAQKNSLDVHMKKHGGREAYRAPSRTGSSKKAASARCRESADKCGRAKDVSVACPSLEMPQSGRPEEAGSVSVAAGESAGTSVVEVGSMEETEAVQQDGYPANPQFVLPVFHALPGSSYHYFTVSKP